MGECSRILWEVFFKIILSWTVRIKDTKVPRMVRCTESRRISIKSDNLFFSRPKLAKVQTKSTHLENLDKTADGSSQESQVKVTITSLRGSPWPTEQLPSFWACNAQVLMLMMLPHFAQLNKRILKLLIWKVISFTDLFNKWLLLRFYHILGFMLAFGREERNMPSEEGEMPRGSLGGQAINFYQGSEQKSGFQSLQVNCIF